MSDEQPNMSDDRQHDRPSAELQVMIDEVRASAPTLDWERLEARLFDGDGNVHERSGVQRISRPEDEASPARRDANDTHGKRGTRVAALAAGLALAASFALALLTPARPVDPSAQAPVPAAKAPVQRAPLVGDDGAAVAVGQRIVASSGAWLRSAGRVSIHLEPGTVATVLDLGERVHLSLESGAVAADVVPVAGGEPFAVDAAGQRVAVHGTRLRVALLGQAVQVAVSEGSAVVGVPRTQGRTEGTLVHFGNVGRFDSPGAAGSLTGDGALATALVDGSLALSPKAPTAVAPTDPAVGAPPAAPVAKTASAAASPADPPAGSAGSPAAPSVGPAAPSVGPATPPAPPGLSAEQTNEPLAKLASSLQTCARKSGAGVVFVNEQTLTIEIAATGKATLVKSEPGLDTADRACWSMVVSALSFPKAEGSTTVQRKVVVGSP